MRCEPNVVGPAEGEEEVVRTAARLAMSGADVLGHLGDPASLADSSSMRDIGLDDVNAACLKVRADILTSEEAFTELS
jgi:hypothetical protein